MQDFSCDHCKRWIHKDDPPWTWEPPVLCPYCGNGPVVASVVYFTSGNVFTGTPRNPNDPDDQ